MNVKQGDRLYRKNGNEILQSMIDDPDKGYIYCECCKTSKNIGYERHHIIWKSEKPGHKNLHDKENLLILCLNCHDEFHSDKGRRNEIVEQRKLYELFGQDVRNK